MVVKRGHPDDEPLHTGHGLSRHLTVHVAKINQEILHNNPPVDFQEIIPSSATSLYQLQAIRNPKEPMLNSLDLFIWLGLSLCSGY